MDCVAGKHFPVVVDIGVGTAPHKKHISHDQYIGIDIEDRGGVADVLIEDVNRGLSIPDNTADLVLCTEVLEHTKDPALVIKELYRVTKQGGRVILTTPLTWPVHEAPNDFYRFTNFGLEYLLQEAGFIEWKIEGSNGYVYSMFALSLLYLRPPIFYPLVFVVNCLGYLSFRFEKNRELPLVEHVYAKK
jgi:SAM-dependent methyltransferase